MFIQNLFIYICDTLFPPSTEALRVRTISTAQVDLLYNETTTSDIITLSAFSHPDIQALIHEAKFHSSVRAQKLLGHLCDMYMEKHSHTFDCIAPIPLSPARYRARGYNQVHEILRYSTHARQILVPNILKRVRDTRAQTSLGRGVRQQFLQGEFSVTNP
jgi:predicted amidophosphoribosyltransferase